MAINNMITNVEISRAILSDVKLKLQEATPKNLLYELKIIKNISTMPLITELELESAKELHHGHVNNLNLVSVS